MVLFLMYHFKWVDQREKLGYNSKIGSELEISTVFEGMWWRSGGPRKMLNFSSCALVESRPFWANLAITNNHIDIAVCIAIITT